MLDSALMTLSLVLAAEPAPLATTAVRFAIVTRVGEVELWHASRTEVAQTGRLRAVADVESVTWLDADTLIVSRSNGEVGAVVGDKFTPYPAVPTTAWQVPRPNSDWSGDPIDAADAGEVFIAGEREVWLRRCLFARPSHKEEGTRYDARLYCLAARWVRLYPSPAVRDLPPPDLVDPSYWPESRGRGTMTSMEAGHRSTDRDTKPPPIERSLLCAATTLSDSPDCSPFRETWIVLPAFFGESPELRSSPRQELQRCPCMPTDHLVEVQLGPRGFWAWHHRSHEFYIEGPSADLFFGSVFGKDLAFAPER